MSTSIVIVDDHELVAAGIANFVKNDPAYELFSVFNDPEEALKKIPILKPDIVLTDLDMPVINGLELIQKLRASIQPKFVLLTMHINQAVMKKVVDLDLDGYLPKNTDEFEFYQCLQTIVAGRKYYSQKAVATLNQKGKVLTTSSGIKLTQSLTERETEILRLIAEGESTKEIADRLFIAVRTVETHRKSIMEKLGVKNMAGMVRIA
ncbi:MAG: response regulator transcription factor, partial [Bacteroidota bacterium]